MLAVCERDCVGIVSDRAGDHPTLFVKGQEYDIDPASSVGIHFRLPAEERKIAVAAHKDRVALAKKNRERRQRLMLEGIDQEDPFLIEDEEREEAINKTVVHPQSLEDMVVPVVKARKKIIKYRGRPAKKIDTKADQEPKLPAEA
jgi:hypothetical protein